MRKYRFCEDRDKIEEDFELNITSVIDCLTVLILYVLVGASFLSIGAIDLGLSHLESKSTDDSKEPPLSLFVQLDSKREFKVILTGVKTQVDSKKASRQGASTHIENPNYIFENSVTTIPPNKLEWNFKSLLTELQNVHQRWPTLQHAGISAENSVKYQDLVNTIEQLRKVFPAVTVVHQLIDTRSLGSIHETQ